MDLSLYNENQIALLEDLTKRTAAGTINWEDVSYNPIGVLVDEKDDGTCEYILTHIISCTTDLSGIILDIELSEHLDILTGKGDVFVTVTKSGVAGFDEINISLSEDPDYEDKTVEQLYETYKDYPVVLFSNALINRLHNLDKVQDSFDWASYTNQDIPVRIKKISLFKLGMSLFEAKDVLGFHKCVIGPILKSF